MSEQPNMSDLLREAAEKLAEASDQLTAALLLEQGRAEKLRGQFRELLEAVSKLSASMEEFVP